MKPKRRGGATAALIIDEAFRATLTSELVGLARRIKARDACTDAEAIERAMAEYDKIVIAAKQRKDDLREAQDRKRAEDARRAAGEPTLRVGLGEVAGNLAALRDKLPKGPR